MWSNKYDYEFLLDSLEKEIRATETTLVDIRARKRRAIHNVLQIMITLWIVSLIILWICSSFFWGREWAASRTMGVVILLLGTPLFIAVLHRVVSIWFRRLERAQESHLHLLRRQKRDKINEIKKATDFDHLHNLLERYDDEKQRDKPKLSSPTGATQSASSPASNPRKRASMFSLRPKASLDSFAKSSDASSGKADDASKQRLLEALAPPISGMPVLGVPSAQGNTESRAYTTTAPPPPSAPYPRGWMDKLADMILGTDPYGATLEDQQFALICRHCFHHNGLVPKNELHETQYICRYCHQFNSRRPSSRPVSSPFAPTRQDSSFSEKAVRDADEAESAPLTRRSSSLREQLHDAPYDDDDDEGVYDEPAYESSEAMQLDEAE